MALRAPREARSSRHGAEGAEGRGRRSPAQRPPGPPGGARQGRRSGPAAAISVSMVAGAGRPRPALPRSEEEMAARRG